MQIPIKCTSTQTLPFQDLHALQGGLKIREKRDIEQLKSSIKEHGFLFPLFIWTAPDGKNHIIDVDAYGIPFFQIDYILSKKYTGIIFITVIQTGMGALPKGLLTMLGYTSVMVKKCPTLFYRDGLNKFKDFLALHGITKIDYIQHNRKLYCKIKLNPE